MSILKKLLEKKRNAVSIFLFISLIILLGTYFYYLRIKNEILKQVQSELRAVAELKIENISNANYDELNDAELISSDQTIAGLIEKTISGDNSFEKKLQHSFNEIRLEHNYENVFLLSTDYKFLVSAKKFDDKISDVILETIKNNENNKSPFSTDVYFCDYHEKFHIDYICRVESNKKTFLGYIVFRKNPDEILFPVLQNYPGEKLTTETILIKKVDGFITPITPLKYKKNAQLRIRIPITKTDFPGVEALKGKKEFFEGVDYRNAQVVSYLSPVPGTNWFMVTKIDKAEIYTKIFNDLLIVLIVIVLMLAALFFFVFWIYHYQQRNFFRQLYDEERAKKEAQDEFETILYSIGDAVIITDKAGNVKNINPVAENLTGWRETEAFGKPIQQVFKIINEETRKEVESPVSRVLKEGIIIGLANHTLLISKDGKEIPIADSGAPIKDDEETIGVVLVFRDQTKEREAKRRVEKSEQRLIRGELVSKSGNWELDLNTKTIFASEGAAKIYGVDKTEIDYNFVKSVPLPEYRQALDNALMKLLTNNEPYDVEFKIKAVDSGEIKDIHSVAIYDKEKNTLFGVIQDITQRKKIEEKLKKSESALLALINNREQSVWSLDENFNLIICNDYFRNAYKAAYDFNLEIGVNLVEILSPQLKEFWKPKYLEALGGKKVTFEFSEVIFGKRFYFEIFLNPIYVDNQIKGVTALSVDITEMVEAKKATEESEEKFRKTFHSSPVALSVQDDDNIFVEVNDAFCEITGYSREEVIGKTGSELNLWEDKNEAAKADELFYKQGFIRNLEFRFRKKSGEIRIGILSSEPILLKGKKADISIAIDITDRKNYEEKILEQLEELRRWQNIMLDREDRVIELKNEVNELLEKLGKDKKYHLDT